MYQFQQAIELKYNLVKKREISNKKISDAQSIDFQGELKSITQAKFFEHRGKMRLDRSFRYEKLLGYFLITCTTGHQPGDLSLSLGE